MKKRCILTPVVIAIIAIACSSFVLLQQPVRYRQPEQPANRDTIPKTEFETGRLDDALKYLDEQMNNFNTGWTEATRENVRRQVDAAMAQLDLAKVKLQAIEAVKKVDWDKINRDIKTATARINTAAMEKKIADAMRRSVPPVDQEKIKTR